MINIYRATRFPDVDQIIFQASDDTYREFSRRFPVNITLAQRGFEGGYYTWLRDDYRKHFYHRIKDYFRDNYVPPQLHLSAFRGNKPLSDRWASNVWQDKVTEAIQTFFMMEGYTVQTDEHTDMVDVLSSQASLSLEKLKIYRVFSFRVQLSEECGPILWCNDRFMFFLDRQPANLVQIIRLYGEDNSVVQKIKQFTSRSAEEQFDYLGGLVARIPALSSCEDLQFERLPARGDELGLKTWFWLHDSDACFETSNGLQTHLTQALLGEGSGLYIQPEDLQLVLLLPEPKSSPVVPKVDWQQVVVDIQRFLEQTMPDVATPVSILRYSVVGDLAPCLQAVETITKQEPERRVLCLMFVPGSDSRFSTNADEVSAEKQSFKLNKALKNYTRGGYTVTVDWNNITDSNHRPYILHNALLSSLYRLNAIPWKIINMPFEIAPSEGNYFLGLYGLNDDHPALAGALFDHEGGLVAFGASFFEDNRDGVIEYFSSEADDLIVTLLSDGVHNSKPKVNHLIIHIPFELQDEAGEIQSILETHNYTYDLSIIHHSSVRLLQPGNQQGTPSHGVALGDEVAKAAYLMNTFSVGERTNRGYIFPNPNTIAIRQIAGPSSIKSLSAQVFWLSSGHINAFHRTVEEPMTISYARALCEHVRKTKRSMRVTRNYRKTLYWL